MIDTQGGRKEEPGAGKRKARGRRGEDHSAEPAADRTLPGLLTEALGASVVVTAGRPPRWLASGIGTYMASKVEPKSVYYRQLRQTALANLPSWPTRANEALGVSDQITPDGLRSIAFAFVEAMMSSEMSQRFPRFVNGMLEGGEKLDDVLQTVYRGHAANNSSIPPASGSPSAIRATPMTGGDPVSEDQTPNAADPYFLPCRLRFQARDLPGRGNPDGRGQKHDALGRPLGARIRRPRALASARADGHLAFGPARFHDWRHHPPARPRRHLAHPRRRVTQRAGLGRAGASRWMCFIRFAKIICDLSVLNAARSVRRRYQHQAARHAFARRAHAGTGERSVQSGMESTIPAELGPRESPGCCSGCSGSFLLRFADRQLRGLLFQPPPRFTRFEAY